MTYVSNIECIEYLLSESSTLIRAARLSESKDFIDSMLRKSIMLERAARALMSIEVGKNEHKANI